MKMLFVGSVAGIAAIFVSLVALIAFPSKPSSRTYAVHIEPSEPVPPPAPIVEKVVPVTPDTNVYAVCLMLPGVPGSCLKLMENQTTLSGGKTGGFLAAAINKEEYELITGGKASIDLNLDLRNAKLSPHGDKQKVSGGTTLLQYRLIEVPVQQPKE